MAKNSYQRVVKDVKGNTLSQAEIDARNAENAKALESTGQTGAKDYKDLKVIRNADDGKVMTATEQKELKEKNDAALQKRAEEQASKTAKDGEKHTMYENSREELNKRALNNLKEAGILPSGGNGPSYAYKIDAEPQNAGEAAQDRYEDILNNYQANMDYVPDYYKNSLTGAYDEASDRDKRILLLDQIGTTLKNIGNLRSPVYSAFIPGGSYGESRGVGTEKSLLQKGMEENFKKGLERRNDRLNTMLDEGLKQASFPAELENQLRALAASDKISNYQKTHLIAALKDVKFVDALKSSFVNDPGKAIGSVASFLKR